MLHEDGKVFHAAVEVKCVNAMEEVAWVPAQWIKEWDPEWLNDVDREARRQALHALAGGAK